MTATAQIALEYLTIVVLTLCGQLVTYASFWPVWRHPFSAWEGINWDAEAPWMHPRIWMTPWLWMPLHLFDFLGLALVLCGAYNVHGSAYSGLLTAACVLWSVHYAVWYTWAVPLLAENTRVPIIIWFVSSVFAWAAGLCATSVSIAGGVCIMLYALSLSLIAMINGCGYMARMWEANTQCKLHKIPAKWDKIRARIQPPWATQPPRLTSHQYDIEAVPIQD